MPDQLTDDQMGRLFADLRAGEVALVRPPGVAAARVALRRRRTATSVAAGVVALALTGGVAALVARPDAPIVPADRPDHGPELEWPEMFEQIKQADASLKIVGEPPFFHSGEADRGGSGVSGAMAVGAYTLRAACVGVGVVTIVVRSATIGPDNQMNLSTAPVDARLVVPCTTAPRPRSEPLVVTGADGVQVTATPDEAAHHRSGFAYVLEPA